MSIDTENKSGVCQEKKLTEAQKESINTIIKDAEEHTPCAADSEKSIDEKYRESEAKRMMLAEALHASREQMRRLMPSMEGDKNRALPFGVFVAYGKNRDTAIIRHHGRLYESQIQIEEEKPKEKSKHASGTFHGIREARGEAKKAIRNFIKGELLLLNNELHIVEPRGFDLICGCLGTVQQVLNDDKILIKTVGEETIIVTRAHHLMNVKVLSGDNVEYDHESLFAYSLLPKSSVDRLVLEKVPDISYEDIGGLDDAIFQIRDSIELPHLYPEYFQEHRLSPPKGILLYGPPGCGKTLIAKAVANSLAKQIKEKTGERGESYFLNVKGPELLNKYVGETEQAIRDLFARARNQASYRTPVIIFFDEMDSLFRVRGSGVSSDMEATIVPQFLAELDGLQLLENIVIIGATNREDLIDPAILRPGRLDRKIRIQRPDRSAALDIFSKYLDPDLPLDADWVARCGSPERAIQHMIKSITDEMYAEKPENEFLEVTYGDGSKKILYLKDFSSGAIIENIVNRAKFKAVKDLIDTGKKGITLDHLLNALRQEFSENEDLPSNTNPAEWYRIIGKGGERVIRIKTLHKTESGKSDIPHKPTLAVPISDDLL